MLPSTLTSAAGAPAATLIRLLNVNSGLLGLVSDNDLSQAAVERSSTVLGVLVSQLTEDLGADSALGCELKSLFPSLDAADTDSLHVNVVTLNGWIAGVVAGFALSPQLSSSTDPTEREPVAIEQVAESHDVSALCRPGNYL